MSPGQPKARSRYRIKRHTGVFAHDSSERKYQGKVDSCYYITYKIDGTKKTEKIGWRSEGYTPELAAEIRAKRIRENRHNGEVKTARDIREDQRRINRPLGEIKDHYFNSERGRALRGRVSDLNRWNLYLSDLSDKSVSQLCPLDVERIKRNMGRKSLSPASIDHVLRLLRRIINHGSKNNICPPLSFKIDFPKVHNTVTEYLTPEEAERLVNVLDNWPRQDIARMVKLAWLTGMRRGECFKLKTDDIDFTHDLIHLSSPKGGSPATIPLSEPVKVIIKTQLDYLAEQKERREARYQNTTRAKPKWTENGYLFPGPNGQLRKDCSAVDRIKEEAQLPRSFRPFHGLRHHLAVTLASSGEYTLDMIGELLTHKDTKVTRRYAAFIPEVKKRAADRAAELLSTHAQPTTTKIKMIKE